MVASEIPMHDGTCRKLNPRRERLFSYSKDFMTSAETGQVDPKSYSLNAAKAFGGPIGNEFTQSDWEQYFANATVRLEEKLNSTKINWCDRNFKTWIAINKERIEPQNIIKEMRNQVEGPQTRPILD